MTHIQKANELEFTIRFLYEKEGRSKKYISRLLAIDYKVVCNFINEKQMEQANVYRLTPSNQKFANRNKNLIKSRLDNDIPVSKIANELHVKTDYVYYIIKRVEVLKKAFEDKKNRELFRTQQQKTENEEHIKNKLKYEDIDGEIWKPILGYENYEISNLGRVRSFVEKYCMWKLLTPTANSRNGRLYVSLFNQGKRQNLQIARLVGFAFIDGYSEINNTINHKDSNVTNNKADNLEWISQQDNNIYAYKNGRNKAYAFKKHKKFKKIILNGIYEFKTIRACAKFVGVSETQMHRYIDKECATDKIISIEFIY